MLTSQAHRCADKGAVLQICRRVALLAALLLGLTLPSSATAATITVTTTADETSGPT